MAYNVSFKTNAATVRDFLQSDKFFRGIRGPVGSGKSVACCIDILRRSIAQLPSKNDQKRRSRWAVVRNTYPELKTTTIKTWLAWFPEHIFGKMNWSPPFTHMIRKGDLELEIIFLALDRPEDVGKLLSLELTGIWFNEAREISKDIIDAGTARVGRFPPWNDLEGETDPWYGVIADTNAPDERHWWGIMSGDVPPPEHLTASEIVSLVKPADWQFFTQPPAMIEKKEGDQIIGYEINPGAENKENLPPDYYTRLIQGKRKNFIDIYVMNKIGGIFDGMPIYTEFNVDVHVAKNPIPYFPGNPIYIGIDFGLTPSAIFGQQVAGQWRILRELTTQNMGALQFGTPLKAVMAEFPDAQFILTGDPAGNQQAQTDQVTPIQILWAQHELSVSPAWTNDFEIRTSTVNDVFSRLIAGQPGCLIDPGCLVLIGACEGGYHYKRRQISGDAQYETTPNKNRFSHPAEALQYMFLGGGERINVSQQSMNMGSAKLGTGFNPYEHKRRPRKRRARAI